MTRNRETATTIQDPSAAVPPPDAAESTPTGQPGDRSTAEHLEAVAQRLAREHEDAPVAERVPSQQLLHRIDQQHSLLREAVRYFQRASEAELSRSYAAEWLLDNYYIVEQTLLQIEEDVPAEGYRYLPQLPRGREDEQQDGVPRIYAVAQGMIDTWEGQFSAERIERFLLAYQHYTPLTMSELWALPVMLRLALLEELSVAIARVTGLSMGASLPPGTVLVGRIDEDVVVASVVPSLRTLLTIDWLDLFERTSRVEHRLRQDPAGIYARMDFATRDQYRQVVERLAWAAGKSEEDVADTVVELAEEASRNGVPDNLLAVPRVAHVGYYLRGEGWRDLHNRLQYRPGLSQRLARRVQRHAIVVYLGGIALLAALLLALITGYAAAMGAVPWQQVLVVLLGLVPALTVAVTMVDAAVTYFIDPQVLPKMDFAEGIPPEAATMVVIPALLTDKAEVESLARQLERHYLASADEHMRFALLTDFADAPQQQMPEDEALLSAAIAAIQQLNERYAAESSAEGAAQGATPFYLFHRERRWNLQEKCWMGWERKRGKLTEFNRLITGSGETSFSTQVGDLDWLSRIRYVITLDADTVLGRGVAQRLVASMAHPLNRPRFHPQTDKVVAGYTVLQPRLEIAPTSIGRSLFARIFAGEIGLDLYTRAVSDVYQDLFGEGIYSGKGIYDVEAFEHSLRGRVPENALLSHDLFEGIQGRAGLVTDVALYEEYPSHYLTHTRRLHRWVRGDWQIAPWLLPRVPCEGEESIRNDLPILGRWKIFDNLRRSLFLPTLLLLWLAGWLGLPGSSWAWTLFGLIALLAPTLRVFVLGALRNVGDRTSGWAATVLRSLERQGLILAFLLHRSIVTMDAIARTLFRLFVTRRRLLEWTAAAHAGAAVARRSDARFVWREMIGAPLLSIALGLLVALIHPQALPVALPFLLLWFVSPQIAHEVSRPRETVPAPLDEEARRELHRVARQIWLFFEHFVGPEDHWLPPDHFQESPRGLVAHRTSPTNIGLLLTATLGAFDLGYLGHTELVARLQNTFETLERLETYRGHLLNWSDTGNLEPLLPRYVSTVDSGNLAACLLVVNQSCAELAQAPLLGQRRWQGLLDTADVLLARLRTCRRKLSSDGDDIAASSLGLLHQIHGQIEALCLRPQSWWPVIAKLHDHDWPQFEEALATFSEENADRLERSDLRQLRVWTERMRTQINAIWRDTGDLLPWVPALDHVSAYLADNNSAPEIAAAWQELLALLPTNQDAAHLPLAQLPSLCDQIVAALDRLQYALAPKEQAASARRWVAALTAQVVDAGARAQSLLQDCDALGQQAQQMVTAMDFGFLFDPQRQAFHIGYNVTAEQLDANYSDLMASEARIASLLAIAKGDVPVSHWLHLGRPLTAVDHRRALLSWSATMFE